MGDLLCDWCYLAGTRTVAMFVVVTADTDTSEVEDWFICMKHADHLCCQKRVNRIMIQGIAIDLWQLNSINSKAREYAKIRDK